MAASPASLTLPLILVVTPGDIKDYDVFKADFISKLPDQTAVVLGDGRYAEDGCFMACDEKAISLLTPIKVRPGTSDDRQERAKLLCDPDVRKVYALRRTTVEPH